jgi:8-amino-7-oxononanoate synthase
MAPFRHNSVHDLEKVLQKFAGSSSSSSSSGSSSTSVNRRVVILVESVYSMDGDVAPLTEMLDVAQRYNAIVVVDEAHGLGVFGRQTSPPPPPPRNQQEYNKDDSSGRMLLLLPRSGTGVLAQYELEHHPALLCSIHTFGKAPGCHGAVVCCRNQHVKDYLVNFAHPFIYSTALPWHAIVTIRASYETFTGRRGDELRARLFQLVQLFQGLMRCILLPMAGDATTRSGGGSGDDGSGNKHVFLLPSPSPIQALMISGNARCADFCQRLYQASSKRVLLYPIKSPTVPVGQERVRIILHAHNAIPEVQELCRLIQATLQEMDLLAVTTKRGGTVTIRGDNMGRSKL